MSGVTEKREREKKEKQKRTVSHYKNPLICKKTCFMSSFFSVSRSLVTIVISILKPFRMYIWLLLCMYVRRTLCGSVSLSNSCVDANCFIVIYKHFSYSNCVVIYAWNPNVYSIPLVWNVILDVLFGLEKTSLVFFDCYEIVIWWFEVYENSKSW